MLPAFVRNLFYVFDLVSVSLSKLFRNLYMYIYVCMYVCTHTPLIRNIPWRGLVFAVSSGSGAGTVLPVPAASASGGLTAMDSL